MLLITDPNEPGKTFTTESKDYNFMKLLKSKWDDLHDNSNAFRYKINNLQEKIVGGYLLQLNPERGSNRRMPELIDNVCQPFDPDKFNFTKAPVEEILFNLVENDNSDTHTLIINVSPISQYHTLLCPSINKCLPQVVTIESFKLCLEVMFLAKDRNLRIGFNSLCGFASVNHLHYHLVLVTHDLPVETAHGRVCNDERKCKQLKGPLYCLKEYPIPAFCFEVRAQNINETCEDVYKTLDYLLKNSIAHNLIITRGAKVESSREVNGEVFRVLIWPRKGSAGVKRLGAFNIALCELSGWFPIYTKLDYENLKTEDLEQELNKWKIDKFDELCDSIENLYNK